MARPGTWRYFSQEFGKFRSMVGQRDVMVDFERRMLAWKGLCSVAMFTKERAEKVSGAMLAAKEDFDRRCVLVDTMMAGKSTVISLWLRTEGGERRVNARKEERTDRPAAASYESHVDES